MRDYSGVEKDDPNSAEANLHKPGVNSNAYGNHPGKGPQPGELPKRTPDGYLAPDPSYVPKGPELPKP